MDGIIHDIRPNQTHQCIRIYKHTSYIHVDRHRIWYCRTIYTRIPQWCR